MTHEEAFRQFSSLPLEDQRQVVDFIAFLHEHYRRSQSEKILTLDLLQESFIGTWQDREDIQNSSAWVRQSRERDANHQSLP